MKNGGGSDQGMIVTGSSGLIGSEVCEYFHARGYTIHGFDNNQREVFFGPEGTTRWNQRRLEETLDRFRHYEIDVRDRSVIHQAIAKIHPKVVVHTAAQPSHDRAAEIPFEDFDTNAVGTLNVMEAVKQVDREIVVVHLSTNKVYGDGPNRIRLREEPTRWEYDDPAFAEGIAEDFPIDRCLHSLFGASKVAADVVVQEYGRYFDIPTCCLRGGCLTGPNHAGVELHGFLSYVAKCNLEQTEYKVFGYKGKQVRDNIHALDVARFIEGFIESPRCAEVYNIGGGKQNSCSVIEAFDRFEAITGKPQRWTYVDENRMGDHICYYSDLSRMMTHYPDWSISKFLDDIFAEIVDGWNLRST